MAIVRKKDLARLNATELKAKLSEAEMLIASEMSAMKSSGRPTNSGRFREAKRLRARILTLLSQKEVKESKAAGKVAPTAKVASKAAKAVKTAAKAAKAVKIRTGKSWVMQ